jgi:kumamolisin
MFNDILKRMPTAMVAAFACATACTIAAADASMTRYVFVRADIPPVPASAIRVPAAGDPIVTVDIALTLARPIDAAIYARRVSTPGDPLRGKYLTAAQFADRFGPTFADDHAVTAWAKSAGLRVHEVGAGRSLISVTGHASRLAAAFGVGFSYFKRTDGTMMRTATTAPSMPADVASKVAGVVGLSEAAQFVPLVERRPIGAGLNPQYGGTGIGSGFAPSDFRTAYQIPQPAVAGPKEVVAVYEQGGFYPSDIATFTAANHLPDVPAVVRPVNGYGGGVDNPNIELEAVLDIETLIGVNPGIKKILVYEDGDDFSVSLLDSLSAMASDQLASVISISYGLDENIQGTTALAAEGTVLTQMAAEGQEVLVSSGDGGAYGDDPFGFYGSVTNVEDPGSQPFVTSVGGTALYTTRTQTYAGEEAWNDLGIQLGSTGGGVSSYWALPSYQDLPNVSTTHSAFYHNGGSDTFRNEPDLAADASPVTGASIYSGMNGGWLVVGGTSLSAPMWAGIVSLYDQLQQIAGVGHVGFFNPAFYNYAGSYAAINGIFNDVRDGSNGNPNEYRAPGFSAGFGWDNVSGIGSMATGAGMFSGLLYNAIGTTAPPATPTHLVGTVSGTTATIHWAPSAGATGYMVYAIDPYNHAYVTEVPTTGTVATVTGLTTKNVYYVFEVDALSPTGQAISSALYLEFGKASALPASRPTTRAVGARIPAFDDR